MKAIASHVKSAIRAKGHPHDGAAGTKAHIGHSILASCPNQTTEMYGQSNSTRSVQKRKVFVATPGTERRQKAGARSPPIEHLEATTFQCR